MSNPHLTAGKANLPKRDASGTVVRDPDTDETVFEKTSFSLKGWSKLTEWGL